jgi:hypothetical protein
MIQLNGDVTYEIKPITLDSVEGTGIYVNKGTTSISLSFPRLTLSFRPPIYRPPIYISVPDELIGVVQDVEPSALSLSDSSTFTFV